ncbi:hypothetical protein BC6307_02580 [Sutcliffiella cohnii]|uniref:Uncharacterized protein n=1 Tax=Sutcliffiella cohnii TaxID=33932 RepID=A0A223KL72_9BACI|nr:hypothetical protein BC6307_02580 [Sutcliffiella cohnii]
MRPRSAQHEEAHQLRKVKAARPGPTSIRQALQLGALCPTEVTGLCLEGQAAVTRHARGKRSIFPERVFPEYFCSFFTLIKIVMSQPL